MVARGAAEGSGLSSPPDAQAVCRRAGRPGRRPRSIPNRETRRSRLPSAVTDGRDLLRPRPGLHGSAEAAPAGTAGSRSRAPDRPPHVGRGGGETAARRPKRRRSHSARARHRRVAAPGRRGTPTAAEREASSRLTRGSTDLRRGSGSSWRVIRPRVGGRPQAAAGGRSAGGQCCVCEWAWHCASALGAHGDSATAGPSASRPG